MARDVHNFSASQSYLRTKNGAPAGGSTTTRVSKRSTRSDAKSTSPLPGTTRQYGLATDYHAFFATSSTGPGECSWRVLGTSTDNYKITWDGWSDRGGCLYGVNPVTLLPNDLAVLVSQTRSQAIEAMRSSNFNLGQFAGEMRETVSSIVLILQQIAKGLRFLRKAHGRPITPFRGKKGLQSYSGAYLAYMFGVLPLMQDIYGIAEECAKGMTFPVGV